MILIWSNNFPPFYEKINKNYFDVLWIARLVIYSVYRLLNVKCLRVIYLLSSHQLQNEIIPRCLCYYYTLLDSNTICFLEEKQNYQASPSSEEASPWKFPAFFQNSSMYLVLGYRSIEDGRSLQCMLVKKHPFIPFHPSTLWLIDCNSVCVYANCKLTAAELLWYDDEWLQM